MRCNCVKSLGTILPRFFPLLISEVILGIHFIAIVNWFKCDADYFMKVFVLTSIEYF